MGVGGGVGDWVGVSEGRGAFFYSKRASSPVKTEVLPKKKVFFYSKRPPSLAKNLNFA